MHTSLAERYAAAFQLAAFAAVVLVALIALHRSGLKRPSARIVSSPPPQLKRPSAVSPIERISSAAFNGAHCEKGVRASRERADALLLARQDTYIGYMTLRTEPGLVFFARLGAAIVGPATGKPSPGCAVSVLSSNEQIILDNRAGPKAPALASRRTQYASPGSREFLPQHTLFAAGGGTSASECVEGGVGSCWLIAAMASVAAHPGGIRRMLQRGGSAGAYVVTLHSPFDASLPPTKVEVEETLPACCIGAGACAAAYAKPATDDDAQAAAVLWPCLVEKACAASGLFAAGGQGYEGLNGGDPAKALQALTGVAPSVFRLAGEAPAAVDATLQSFLETGEHAICLASAIFDAHAQSDTISRDGVQQDHCYSLLASRPRSARHRSASSDLDRAEADKPPHEFQLRNPWGRRGLAQPGVPLRDASDGLFWMTADTIAELFVEGYAVRVSQDPDG